MTTQEPSRIEVLHRDNEWYRDQIRVKNAKQGVELLYWPHAGRYEEGHVARLALKWATIPTYSAQNPVVIPDVCLLLELDAMRALRDRAAEVVRLMEEAREEALRDEEEGDDD